MNKLNKGKKIGILTCVLASMSLVGVGFSTWIIETRTGNKVESISVKVAETINASVVISEASATDNSVNFDANYNSKVEGSLLSCNSTDKEDLSFAFRYKVVVGTSISTFKINAAIDDTSSNYTSAVDTYKYIELPTTLGLKTSNNDGSKECYSGSSSASSSTSDGLTVEVSTEDSDTQTKTFTITQTFTFKWGEAFCKKNPVAVTTSDTIYTYSSQSQSSSASATLDTLTTNTKGLNSLSLSTFTVILSIGDVTTNASQA